MAGNVNERVAARVAVVGAGYAGLAAAVELAGAGIKVDVFEASRTLGGRARAVEIKDELGGLTVDNGAHILVGAYRETLRLMAKVGAGGMKCPVAGTASAGTPRKLGTALRRESLHLEFPGQVRIAAPRLPAPLHLAWALLSAQGLSFKDKLAAIRFMRTQQARNFRLAADMTAAELFADQPARVRRYLWEPLCLAALNTPVGIASAQVFLNVLRDSLAADRAASDLLLPATDFSSLFPEPAARYLEEHGSRVLRSTRITEVEKVGVTEGNPLLGTGWTASGLDETHGPYDHLILATAPYHLPQLLAPHPEFAALCRQIELMHWQPIVTAYLAYPPAVRLPFAMVGSEGGHAQWLFDRGALCGQHGLIAAVISGDGPHQALDHTALAAAIHDEIAGLLPDLPAPQHSWVIEEKRATFACTPDMQRPPTATSCANVWLAGDYVAGDYPATLEGAIRSGVAAARAVLREMP
ncbi:MAG: hydroxysqualene dehydroxylase HpnE [Gammaproteobacteria bacterium]|nr:desaturase [Rhodocyclaceae bacterium]MBU3908498.1 hydroxysqualene dehydroxylase HpnE [Gammaproteobacteria bacterium]MBU3988619.1 hydroxysqualene dehydroxylase HpnE [Gammaproteobacteria bacterium]MBU4004526.1 hydroxysqualene dehydroxylase HpnE [Gammaproteobacteria bacterium]MBU4021129.1 hydroxysqualene dehydroxylase HpnE [Gammaproteobacteria bacterium]